MEILKKTVHILYPFFNNSKFLILVSHKLHLQFSPRYIGDKNFLKLSSYRMSTFFGKIFFATDFKTLYIIESLTIFKITKINLKNIANAL